MRKAVLVVLIPLICVTPVTPAVIVVEGECTLPDAIASANSDTPVGSCTAGSGTDTIELTGDVLLTAIDNGVNGLPKISSSIVIEGNGFGISRSDTAPAFRILEVTDSLVLKNTTISNGLCDGCPGGGIRSLGGSVEVIDSRITENTAYYGGGLQLSHSSSVLRNTTVSKNSIVLNPIGAGVDQFYGTLTITGSTITGNLGNGVDVAFYSFQGTTIVNSTISGNSGRGIHMGVYSSGGTLTNSTVLGNSIYVYPGAMTVQDSIVTGGSCFGVNNGGGNFDDNGSCGGQPITGVDPVLRRNGGKTFTHALLEGSSAIDALANCPVASDQRGFGRGATCDSGAFEFGSFRFGARGECPAGGKLSVRAAALEPDAVVEIYQGPAEGASQVMGGACDGTELGITDPVLLGQFVADANGRGRVRFDLPAGDCGQFLQAVESTTCGTSGVLQIGSD